jgi:REP element-mobilizing transposase RayT
MAVENRDIGWLDDRFHAHWREVMLHALARYRLACPVYCLMPDHAHVIWLGMGEGSDQRAAIRLLRTYTTPVLRGRSWQRQMFDHVLRQEERDGGAFTTTCHYVRENPVRAGLCTRSADYSYSGAMITGYPSLDPRHKNFWELFWKLYNDRAARSPAEPKS